VDIIDIQRMASVPALLHNPYVPQAAKDWVMERQRLAEEPSSGGNWLKCRRVVEAALYFHSPLVVATVEADILLDWGGRFETYTYKLFVNCEGRVASVELPGFYAPTAAPGYGGYPYTFWLGWVKNLSDDDTSNVEVVIHLKRGPYEDWQFPFSFAILRLEQESRPE
jgi:hypothetical protein